MGSLGSGGGGGGGGGGTASKRLQARCLLARQMPVFFLQTYQKSPYYPNPLYPVMKLE